MFGNQNATQKKFSGFKRSILEHRDRLNIAKPVGEPADVPHRDILIPLKQNVSIPIRVYIPKNIKPPYATILYVPGTAFVAREIAFTEIICTHLAEKSKCQVIIINHRLAPEDQYPKGLDDAYSLMRFIVNSPDTLFKIDKTRIAIVGYSSGGNFAANMSICAKNEKLSIARQILISPMVDLSRSLKDFKTDFEDKDTAITDTFVEWFLNLYVPEGIDKKTPWLSPFWHRTKDFKGLPPTDIIFAEYDRFRSDSEGYYKKLDSAGVDVRELMVKGEDHSFLWYKIEIIETLGRRITMAFNLESMPRFLGSAQDQRDQRLLFIRPNPSSIENDKTKDPEENNNQEIQKGFKIPSKL